MVSNVKKGDKVVTGGGLIGTVTDVSENEVDVDFDGFLVPRQRLFKVHISIWVVIPVVKNLSEFEAGLAICGVATRPCRTAVAGLRRPFPGVYRSLSITSICCVPSEQEEPPRAAHVGRHLNQLVLSLFNLALVEYLNSHLLCVLWTRIKIKIHRELTD